MDKKQGFKIMAAACVLLAGVWTTAQARVIYVDDDANAPGDGLSWRSPYRYLQDALADAESGDKPVEIRVAQGIYRPDRSEAFPDGTGDCEATFRLISGVTIKGGFAGIAEPDPNAGDVEVYETILSGDLAGNDVEVNRAVDMIAHPTRAENSRHVVTAGDTEPNAVLEGFTISGGNAEPPLDVFETPSPTNGGGGMLSVAGSPTLVRCTFVGNTAGNGGGLYCRPGNPRLIGCTFRRNAAKVFCDMPADFVWCQYGEGGGMYVETGEPCLDDCVFEENFAYAGGGVLSRSRKLTLFRCTFVRNVCPAGEFITPPVDDLSALPLGEGGGLVHDFGSAQLSECVFLGNSADNGGGIAFSPRPPSILERCVFRDNTAKSSGGAIRSEGSCDYELVNCVMTGNQAGRMGGAVEGWRNVVLSGRRCVFTGNHALYGGVLSIDSRVDARLAECTLADNAASFGSAIACLSSPVGYESSLQLTNCILWNDGFEIDDRNGSVVGVTYCDVQGSWPGEGNIDSDPLFAALGYWDPNGTPDDASDDLWVDGDYHLASQAGRWDPTTESWVIDEVTSLCIDAGDPTSPIGLEPFPHGGRINMGAYGGTAEASESYFGEPLCETIIAGDINGDCRVDFTDLLILVEHWHENRSH